MTTKIFCVSTGLLVAVLLFFPAAAPTFAGNDDCLMCHQSMEYGKPSGDTPRIHDPSGNFLHEAHGILSCTDCHSDITEVPHRQGIDRKITCENCHN